MSNLEEVNNEEHSRQGAFADGRNARLADRRRSRRVLPSVADREAWTVEQRAAQSMRSRLWRKGLL